MSSVATSWGILDLGFIANGTLNLILSANQFCGLSSIGLYWAVQRWRQWKGKMVPVYGNSRLNPLMWKLVGVTFLVSTEMKEGFGPVQINVATWSSMSRLVMSWQNIYFS